ncbi:GGDEF domain-containing protein [Novosphingobium resinovorum]|uniref:GGDEF domain-containing protein n=1 Tax=Novosphingobium resinovorum TaxID=158500 RepID=UPI002ED1A0C3|nr:GGDEF domain-containing protein [Novosphingobium resinovorum]
MHFPDVDTLRLCSILASTAFGVVFMTLWLRERGERHFACWGLSSLLYGLAILTFSFTPPGAAVFVTMLYALLGVTNVLPVAGARLLEGERAWARWMIVPVASAAIGHGLPQALAAAGWLAGHSIWQTVGDALGLSISMGLGGYFLGFTGAAPQSSGRRMAGLSMLAYLPGYAGSIAATIWATPGAEWVALLAMLSDQVLLGVLNLGLLAIPVELVQRRLRDAALRDPLTGAWNRGGFAHIAPRFAAQGSGVIALDVDHFEAVNDRFGHAEGDAVLTTIVRETRLLAAPCASQIVRLGGDEFLVLVPSGEDADGFARALQARLAIHREAGAGWSVSMGIARVEADEGSVEPAIRRADASLYLAKAAGRAGIAA